MCVENSFGYTLVESDGGLIGYGIVDKVTVDIVQLAVDFTIEGEE